LLSLISFPFCRAMFDCRRIITCVCTIIQSFGNVFVQLFSLLGIGVQNLIFLNVLTYIR
jgi:hypothetical protein